MSQFRRAVVKIGSSSVADSRGKMDDDVLTQLADGIRSATSEGVDVALVSSGAIAVGLAVLGWNERPNSLPDLQVLAAVGQGKLMERYAALFAERGLRAGQVLLTAGDFADRSHYLNARATLNRMLELGVIPVVNENDSVGVDEIKFGDNDRLAALVAQLVGADILVLLTDTEGLYTEDPRLSESASLIEEVVAVDRELRALAGGSSSQFGSGGMASKLAAAKMASWSGVETVIASSREPGVVERIVGGDQVGTRVRAHSARLSSRRLWIAFGTAPSGTISVDAGAWTALTKRGASLLPIGVTGTSGRFFAGEAVEVTTEHGEVFAKGISRIDSERLAAIAGTRSEDLPADVSPEVIHRDDLVVLPES